MALGRHLILISLLALVNAIPTTLRADEVEKPQPIEKVQPSGTVKRTPLSKPLVVVGEVGSAAKDFATFRDPQWSFLTIAQIGAASADAVTSLNNFHACPTCAETGISRIFVGVHPDAHKYIMAGILEIGIKAVTAHHFRNHSEIHRWYWRALWELPQSLSLFEHSSAALHNTRLQFGFSPPVQASR